MLSTAVSCQVAAGSGVHVGNVASDSSILPRSSRVLTAPRWTPSGQCSFPLRGWVPSVSLTVLVCVSAALPSQGELRGGEPSPAEPDPAAEPAEPDAAGAEHGEQGAVPRGAETVHVSAVVGVSARGPCTTVLSVFSSPSTPVAFKTENSP